MMKLKVFSETDIGRVRAVNQDQAFSWVHSEAGENSAALLLVADGMGGYEAGEVASRMVIDRVSAGLITGLKECARGLQTVEKLERLFRETVLEANGEIYQYALSHLGPARSMGTTIAGIAIVGEEGVVASVGDTRVYVMGRLGLEQVTEDHTLPGELVAEGYIDAEDVIDHPQRHILNRALGTGPRVEVDIDRIEIEVGDRVLVCSDGLWGMVRDVGKMEGVLERAKTVEEAVWEMIELANRNGGEDNIGVAVCDVGERRVVEGWY